MSLSDDPVFGGFFVEHPCSRARLPAGEPLAALLTSLARERRLLRPRTFVDAEAAAVVALAAQRAEVHGLWLPAADAERLLEEEADSPGDGLPGAYRLLRRRHGARPQVEAVRSGWDVLGFAGESCLSWHRERDGQAAAARVGCCVESDLIADGDLAERLAEELNADDLGGPVLWRRWWRTVHLATALRPQPVC